MSANLIVDLGNAAQAGVSIAAAAFPTSGGANAYSGAIIGQTVDMLHSDTYCNLHVAGLALFTSGELRIGIQTADSDVSGSFTDPTSGLSQMPGAFASGGILYINSGGTLGGVLGGLTSGQAVQSGFSVYQGFQRPHRFARAIMFGSGAYAGNLMAGFVAQNKTTGSGGGFSFSPTSGTVNV